MLNSLNQHGTTESGMSIGTAIKFGLGGLLVQGFVLACQHMTLTAATLGSLQ